MTGFLLVVMVLDAPTKDPVFSFNILLFVCHPGLKTNLRLPAVPLCLCSPDKISLFIYPKPQKDPIRGLFQRHEIIEYFYALINFW